VSRQKPWCAMLVAGMACASAAVAADFRLNNLDAGTGKGLDDPTPAEPVGGNPGRTRGEQAHIAFEFAASLWGAVLRSRVPITIDATFKRLACDVNTAALGSAGAISSVYFNPGQQPPDAQPNTLYHIALASALRGSDINFAQSEIKAEFNSDIGTPGCLEGDQWYFGLDGKAAGKRNFLHTLLHEFAHGLGFTTFTNRTTGRLPVANDGTVLGDIYAGNVFDHAQGKWWYEMTNAQRLSAMTSEGNLVFAGSHVSADASRALNAYKSLYVTAPASLAGEYGYYWVNNTADISGAVIRAATGANAEACTELDNAAAVAGHIVMIDFGANCSIDTKLRFALAARATGVIIVDDRVASEVPLTVTGGLPVVAVSKADGDWFKANIEGLRIEIRLVRSGMDSYGNVKLFAPRTFVPGTSFVHFDTSLWPTPLMTPYDPRGEGRDHLNLDLTPSLFQDEGWRVNAGSQLLGLCDTGVPTWVPGGAIVGANIVATAKLLAGTSATAGDYATAMREYANKLAKDQWLTAAQASSLDTCLSDTELAKQYASWRKGGSGGPVVTELDSREVAPKQAGALGSESIYRITVPAGVRALNIRTFGGTGDVSLLVKMGGEPTTSSYHYRSAHPFNSESVVVARPAAGAYFIKVVGVSAYAGVTVQATYLQ